jgi:hypothetical protein
LLDYGIVFALGFLIAGLLGFAMLPVVWSRALRLTRRQLETGIPISMAEVKAGQDLVRAEAALELRRLETKIDSERDRRHAVMAESGRQIEMIRRLMAESQAKDQELKALADGGEKAQRGVADAEEAIASLKAELAAAQVNLSLRDQIAEEKRREAERARMENDGLRVEIVAMRTKLAAAEEELSKRGREYAELTETGVDRDGRIALQAADLAQRSGAIESLENQILVLEQRLAEKTSNSDALAGRQAELESRCAALMRDIANRDVLLDEREGMIAAAAEREQRLTAEIDRLHNDAQRAAHGLSQGVEALRQDRQAISAQLEAARAERARLQAEVMALKRETRESWLAIETDNRQLRIAMARIAAEIARQAAESHRVSLPPTVNGSEAGQIEAPRLSLPDPDAKEREGRLATPNG